MDFAITPEEFEYLAIQRGGLAHLRNDFKLWKGAYENAIERDFHDMEGVLPERVNTMLDVGGGLSGIGARINKHYGGIEVTVLDGRDDAPVVHKHSMPFNSERHTRHFLQANGVEDIGYLTPEQRLGPPTHHNPRRQYELIVSTQAWCFHIQPELYLIDVKRALLPGGVLIVDVRRGKKRVEYLHEHFQMLGGLAHADKWVRVAFTARETE